MASKNSALVSSIDGNNSTKRGLLWSLVQSLDYPSHIKYSLILALSAIIDQDFTDLSSINKFANSFVSILQSTCDLLPDDAQHIFIIFFMAFHRDLKTEVDKSQLVSTYVAPSLESNAECFIQAILIMFGYLFQDNDILAADKNIAGIIADRVYRDIQGQDWEERNSDAIFAQVQIIIRSIVAQISIYNNSFSEVIISVPNNFDMTICAISVFYGVSSQITELKKEKFAREMGTQHLFPSTSEIWPGHSSSGGGSSSSGGGSSSSSCSSSGGGSSSSCSSSSCSSSSRSSARCSSFGVGAISGGGAAIKGTCTTCFKLPCSCGKA